MCTSTPTPTFCCVLHLRAPTPRTLLPFCSYACAGFGREQRNSKCNSVLESINRVTGVSVPHVHSLTNRRAREWVRCHASDTFFSETKFHLLFCDCVWCSYCTYVGSGTNRLSPLTRNKDMYVYCVCTTRGVGRGTNQLPPLYAPSPSFQSGFDVPTCL